MCTYATVRIDVDGSGKGANGWFAVDTASVYFDHPVHATPEHTLNIDFLNPSEGPGARVAVELSADSARSLQAAIQEALDAVPPGVAGLGSQYR